MDDLVHKKHPQYRIFLGSDITSEIFVELLQYMIESNSVKLRKKCLPLPKEEPKDVDMTTNRQ